MQQNNDTIFSEIESMEIEITSLESFFIRLLDFVIDIFFLFLIYKLIPLNVLVSIETLGSFAVPVVIIVVGTVYRFLFLLLFNKTIGMMMFKAKLLNKQFQPLSNKEKLLSLFRTSFSQIKLYKEK